eukprot:scaffold31815_cov118-Isochrysis_galbana.AAC.26
MAIQKAIGSSRRALGQRGDGCGGCQSPTACVIKGGHLIDGFPTVSRVGDAKAERKVEALDQPVFKVVPLNHAEVLHGLRTHRKVEPASEWHTVSARPVWWVHSLA